jgi:hypothetical protein
VAGRAHVARARGGKSPRHCGPGSAPPFSSKRSFNQLSAVSSGELAAAASSSNPP